MYRDILWPAFDRFYDVSVDYIGQGYGFVSKYLALNNRFVFGNNIRKFNIELQFLVDENK